ncbi:golgin subfamily A member 7/ERF4 [Purpureocillium lavendulum]|uniref:Golgin subfamily A member 7/ERF4 n=1 Tax=Purpureocillium lavendulum TaxID=1247861 RepID=A0AB34G6G5_9HYPO|nr:golgin subfamily A member 7/ERF4 [Purpureocillium lavendulum]
MRHDDFNSYASALNTRDLQHLKLKHSELLSGLNTVDQLRDGHLGKYVELPQIVVIGDQSSGKSSVLEAISRVRFPSKSSLGTRFATELVLRDAPEPRMEVSIKPHETAPEDVRERLSRFSASETELGELSGIINKASAVMGINDGSRQFSKHILCVKISGPGIPPLTLVDLPGFYYAKGLRQSDEHRALVNELAAEYMSQEASIILAVISAKNGLEMQKVVETTKQYDREASARNTSNTPWKLKHGWYVLRNRAEREDVDCDTRDKTEAKLFGAAPWTAIRDEYKGVGPLRQKLSDMLLSHTAAQLPRVTSRIRELIEERQQHLTALGEPRIEPRDCTVYLIDIARKFERLSRQAVGGESKDSDFFDAICEGSQLGVSGGENNLRARVRTLNRIFVAIMGKYGSKWDIKWREEGVDQPWVLEEVPDDVDEYTALYDVPDQETISQDELERRVQGWAEDARGNEFPDQYSTVLMLTLFEKRVSPWKPIARRHLELVAEAAERLVAKIVSHVSGEDHALRDRLMDQFVAPFFADRKVALREKLKELLPDFNGDSHMLALEWVYTDKTERRAKQRFDKKWGDLVSGYTDGQRIQEYVGSDAGLQERALGHAQGAHQLRLERLLDSMVEFYGMTIETFLTNVITLAVEKQLMTRIPHILTADKVAKLDDDKLKELAEESEDSQADRCKTEEDLAKLKRGLELCERWRKSSTNASRSSSNPLRLPPLSQQPSYPSQISAVSRRSHRPDPHRDHHAQDRAAARALNPQLPQRPLTAARHQGHRFQSSFRNRAATACASGNDDPPRRLLRLSSARLWNPTNSTPRNIQPRSRRRSSPPAPPVPLRHPTLELSAHADDLVASAAGDYPLLTLPEQRQLKHSPATRASLQIDRRGSHDHRISLPRSVRASHDGSRSQIPTPGPQEIDDEQLEDFRPSRIDKGKGRAIMATENEDPRRSFSRDLERGPDVMESRPSNVSVGDGIGPALSSSNSSIMGEDVHPDAGEEWGPQHPCYPHLNPHVPMDSAEYATTRIIRIRRDWLLQGDLAPTFSNLYPEILDPAGISEQEFRRVIEKLNGELIPIFDPYSLRNVMDSFFGLVTGWLWDDFGLTGIKARLNSLEKWIDRWNAEMAKTLSSEDGVIPPKIIPLRRTGYMTLDIQIPDPEIAPAPSSTGAGESRTALPMELPMTMAV